MKYSNPRAFAVILSGCFVALAVAPAGQAQEDFSQTVARVAFVQGDGSLQRGDDPSSWQPLAVNVPMTIGDRVWTGDAGRLELQAPGLVAFLAPRTDLTALNLTEDVQQYSVAEGTATIRVVSMDDEDVFEIDTPNAAVTLERPGLYRVYVDADGNTRFAVRLGEALVAAAGGEVSLRAGEEMIVTGIDDPEYDVVAIPLADSWDRWVTSRERRRHDIVAYDYTSSDVVGAEDLDAYGDWETVPQYGRVWRPRSVAASWAPYRIGHWIWQDPWGWTWVSAEPWGWAPYHYGRWVMASSRWCWVPVAPNVRHVAYAPALVAFVGGGPGWSLNVSVGGGGYVGWFPLAPRDPFVPWWGHTSGSLASSRAVYANRNYATVVARSAFEGARPAQTAMVRDAGIVRQVQSAAGRARAVAGPSDSRIAPPDGRRRAAPTRRGARASRGRAPRSAAGAARIRSQARRHSRGSRRPVDSRGRIQARRPVQRRRAGGRRDPSGRAAGPARGPRTSPGSRGRAAAGSHPRRRKDARDDGHASDPAALRGAREHPARPRRPGRRRPPARAQGAGREKDRSARDRPTAGSRTSASAGPERERGPPGPRRRARRPPRRAAGPPRRAAGPPVAPQAPPVLQAPRAAPAEPAAHTASRSAARRGASRSPGPTRSRARRPRADRAEAGSEARAEARRKAEAQDRKEAKTRREADFAPRGAEAAGRKEAERREEGEAGEGHESPTASTP